MPRPVRPPPLAENDPALLPEATRDYYRSTWGFDPVTDCRGRSTGGFRYEECFPLPQDLHLQAVGVTICARVEWNGEGIHNRIVFRRTNEKGQRRKASVECTHTVVYAGPASDALTFAEDLDTFTSPPGPRRARLLGRGTLLVLPPWEHFVALKSYVAAVADMGVIALLRQSNMASTGTEDGLSFGFNTEMREQVARALRTIAPRAMVAIFRDLTCEFLDTNPPVARVDQWMDNASKFVSTSKHKHWGFLLRNLGAPALTYWFRHTGIADKFQDRLFSKPALLSKAQMIAPDLPWETLRLEWEARRWAEDVESSELCDPRGRDLNSFPPAEVWARTPFSDYTFPRDILAPDTPALRRARVLEMLRHPLVCGADGGGLTISWARKIASHLDTVLAAPFPADVARQYPFRPWNPTRKLYVDLTPAEVVDRIEHGGHERRREVVLDRPIPPDWQEKLATHWDFATRLALVGNPGTTPAVLATLARDPQPCVQLTAAARVRRGTETIEPLFGEILDPGELVWLLSSHPEVDFFFGVTAWGDGSDAYRAWSEARMRERCGASSHQDEDPKSLYVWAYDGGFFIEETEREPYRSHLAYHGLTPYACGQWPCLFLGFPFLVPGEK